MLLCGCFECCYALAMVLGGSQDVAMWLLGSLGGFQEIAMLMIGRLHDFNDFMISVLDFEGILSTCFMVNQMKMVCLIAL